MNNSHNLEITIDEQTWVENAQIVKQFIDQRTNYEALCQEVAYILETIVEKNKIEYSSISHRTKSLKSFLEKIHRKKYSEPFKKITDFAGVRLVFLYNSDFDKIEKIIYENFDVQEKVDKLNDKGIDKFGYGAIHYIIQLSKKHSGARYDNLKKVNCEIQVRTVLQDSWAVIDHHLVYKNESSVPTKLRRELNSLAGLFESADHHLNNIKIERQAYIENMVKLKSNPRKFLQTQMDIDSFCQYLEWKFPNIYRETWTGQMEYIFRIVQKEVNFKTLKVLDQIVEKHKAKYELIAPKFINEKYFKSSSVTVALSVAIEYSKVQNNKDIPKEWREAISELKSNKKL